MAFPPFMLFFCPICSEKWKIGQKAIQCTSCEGWVHHNNVNNCSGLTNLEFESHCYDNTKLWECDKCIIAKQNNRDFSFLPFINCDSSFLDNMNINQNNHKDLIYLIQLWKIIKILFRNVSLLKI